MLARTSLRVGLPLFCIRNGRGYLHVGSLTVISMTTSTRRHCLITTGKMSLQKRKWNIKKIVCQQQRRLFNESYFIRLGLKYSTSGSPFTSPWNSFQLGSIICNKDFQRIHKHHRPSIFFLLYFLQTFSITLRSHYKIFTNSLNYYLVPLTSSVNCPIFVFSNTNLL